jgi:hypothetical protein
MDLEYPPWVIVRFQHHKLSSDEKVGMTGGLTPPDVSAPACSAVPAQNVGLEQVKLGLLVMIGITC